MAIERVFLGWDGPCLLRAARWLQDRYKNNQGCWDLGTVTVAVPGRRAGRRLLEVLTEAAPNRSLLPPEIVTAGELPEQLYEADPPIADPLRASLARAHCLRQADPDLLGAVVTRPQEQRNWQEWISLAADLARVDDELAAGAIGVEQVVSSCGAKVDFSERKLVRWRALAELRRGYEKKLADSGLQDRHTARQRAIENRLCGTDRDIILLATADLHLTTQRITRQAAQTGHVAALIHAPQSLADRFDDAGCFIPEKWFDLPLDLDEDSVRVVDRPRDQAQAVLRIIDEAASPPRPGATPLATTPDQITVGMGDETLGPTIQRWLDLAGVPSRLASDRPVTQTRPAVLLAALGRYAGGERFDDLASLLRHPDLGNYLQKQLKDQGNGIHGWLTLLDDYATRHLQAKVTQPWLGNPKVHQPLKTVRDTVHDAAHELLLSAEERPLPDWSGPIAETLEQVYSFAELNPHHADDSGLIRALTQITRVLREQAELDPASPITPRLTFPDAARLTLARLAEQDLPPEGGDPAVELLGWLELQLDDAPVLIVTGFNEGHVPHSRNADAFLPDHVRSSLGLEDNRRRHARDLMLLHSILASREHVTLIAGRRDQDDNPLKPSRLLLSGDVQQAARALSRFYPAAHQRTDSPPRITLLEHGGENRVVTPLQRAEETPTQLRITAFRDYLACPHCFYIKHVLKLETIEDRATELDALAFGNVAHEILRHLGENPPIDLTREDETRRFLLGILDDTMLAQYGPNPRAAVRIQHEHLRRRLARFAQWQAAESKKDWVIQHVETELKHRIEVDGQPFTITGRIDRIDYHPEHGHRVLDYKTGNSAKNPGETHKSRGQWIDLQLPLYHLLAREIGIEKPKLGYILLPKDEPELAPANWGEPELQSAIDRAKEVIRAIRAGDFSVSTANKKHMHTCLEGRLDQASSLKATLRVERRGEP